MKPAPSTRTLTAWLLYASVLFSLFACGLHHGQMTGLALSGLDGGYCSLGHDASDSLGDNGSNHAQMQFTCPLCSSYAAAVALNSDAWQLDLGIAPRVVPLDANQHPQPPPRERWPSLNPRASPALFLPA